MDRYLLSAAVERLISSKGHDEAARNTVAEFGRTLPNASQFQFEASITKDDDIVTGETPEHGVLQLRPDTSSTREFAHETCKERVGFYKLWRHKDRRKDWILISHFWKSDHTTESDAEPAEQWVLALTEPGAPLWFGVRGLRSLFSLTLFKGIMLQANRELYLESWGPSIGHRHNAGILLTFLVT